MATWWLAMHPLTECCALFTEKREGVKLRHVKRNERVQNEFTEERMTTFEEEVKGVSLIKQLWPSTRYQGLCSSVERRGLGPPSPMAFTYTKPDVPDQPGAPFFMSCNCVVSGRGVAATEIRQRTRGRGLRVTKVRHWWY